MAANILHRAIDELQTNQRSLDHIRVKFTRILQDLGTVPAPATGGLRRRPYANRLGAPFPLAINTSGERSGPPRNRWWKSGANPSDEQLVIRSLGQGVQGINRAAKCLKPGAGRRCLYREKYRLVDFSIKSFAKSKFLNLSYQYGNHNEVLLLIKFDHNFASHVPVERLSNAAQTLVTRQLGNPKDFGKTNSSTRSNQYV